MQFKEKQFLNIMKKLPIDIVKNIESYFITEEQCDEMLDWWNRNHMLNCCSLEMEQHMNYLLKDKQAIEYLGRKNEYFNEVYEQHFIENKITFILMNKTNSLITSVLMYMWH